MKETNLSYKTHLLRISAIFCLLSSYLWIAPSQVHAAAAGFQEYYVLGNEEQIYNMFDRMDTMEGGENRIYGNRMRSVVAIVATTDNQVICYDHWEDGYEADIFSPTQSSTEIYGDGNPSNGWATPGDILRLGSIISLKSDGSGSGMNAAVPVNPRGTALRYDGGDHLLTIGGPVDLVHAMWPTDTTWIGGAWEVYSLQAWAQSFSYRIPVGVNSGFGDFVYVWLQVEALYDDTTVSIDNGPDSVTVNLDKGQTYSSMGYIDSQASTPITINEGTTISSDKQTQVGLVTGGHVEFQTRFFVMIPDLIWGTEYIAAIPRTTNNEETEIYLYNPNDHSITVETHDTSGDDSITITARDLVPYSQQVGYVPSGSAVRLHSDDVFWGLVCADTSNDDYDWGFSLIPTLFLTDDYYVSWAPGNLDTTDNAAPVWVTPVADNTTFYVYYGPVDPQQVQWDETFTIDALDVRRIFDPDNDNTGMRIRATNKFATIWGIDPASGQADEGYLDLGYTILPLHQGWLDPVLSLEKTANPGILPVEGGTATFILQAKTYSPAPVTNVDITDTLPISWTYVAGSTIVTYPDGSEGYPEPTINGQDLFWDLSHEMDSNQTLSLQFDAQIQTGGSVGPLHFDGFESNNYGGGTGGWLSDWIESEGNGPAAGDIRIVDDTDVDPYSGDRQLQIADDDQTIYREIDLSSFSRPVLRFKRHFRSLEASESFGVDISADGSPYTSLLSWTYPAVIANTWIQEEIGLSAYITDTARIRFRGISGVGSGDYFHLDDVEIYDAVVVNENEGQVVGEYRGYVFNATDEAVVHISAFGLEKAVDRSMAGVGDTIEYTLSYRNNGTITTTGTSIHDTVPWGTTFSGASNGGSYSSATNTVSWALGDVGPSETGSVTFTVTVDDGTPYGTVIENSAQINSDQTGQASSNVVETTVLALATIYGTVFDDADGDGVQGAGEVGIANVLITLDDTITTTTTSDGSYVFSTTVEGVHTVVETDPAGYFSTTSNQRNVHVQLGNSYEVNFGDADGPYAAIYGTVFDDADVNGIWDAGEVGIPGVTITLDGGLTATTDLYGGYTFSTTVEGVHTVVETDPDDYFSTTPNTVTLSVELGQGYQVDFGDAPDGSPFAAIYGTVFEDADRDGAWGADEVGITGVLITLDGVFTTTSGSYGGYTFSTAVEGIHTVVETDPGGYFSTTPNTVTQSVELGQGYQVDFGDAPLGACICPPDGYEEDDIADQAIDLSVGVTQTHDFCDDATDWITFTVQAGDIYIITTSSWGQRADTFLALFDTDASTLLAANDDYEGVTDYSSRIVWQATADGVYYVHTTNRVGLTGCATDYDLLIERQEQPGPEQFFYYLPIVMRNYGGGGGTSHGNDVYPTGVISHTCPDDYETDDTWQQAQLKTPIEPGVVQVHSFDSDPQLYAADKDFVEFDVSAGRTITFTVAPINNTPTLLELYDEHGAFLNVTGTTQLVWTPATDGYCYLSVSPLTTTFGCADAVGYNLFLAEAPIPPVGPIYLPIIMRNY